MNKLIIVDYGIGNLLSVARALEHLGLNVEITANKNTILNASKVILPGVGAFGHCMDEIRRVGLDETILEYIEKQRHLLGICVGMQVLHSFGYEFGEHKGLDVIPGTVRKIIMKDKSLKIPYVGWSKLCVNHQEDKRLSELLENKWFYFVHSYAAITDDPKNTLATYTYGDININATSVKDNVIGLQFHPEKSGDAGLKFLEYFANMR